ncbi:MAG TPA: hypothetical protein VM580_03190, partial [Labilithrix sp.]|nr:hypothetical protein [Labilithrix sp.]
MELGELASVAIAENVVFEKRERLVLRSVGGRDARSRHEAGVEVTYQVTLVPVEALRLAFPTVTHVRLGDRNPTILRDTATDSRASAGRIGLEIL